MADFPMCPSSKRTGSKLPPLCRGAVKTGRFYRKAVFANLFAKPLFSSRGCTAQSLSHQSAQLLTAPFTQGSLCRVHLLTFHRPACSSMMRSIYSQTPARFSFTALFGIRITVIPYCSRYRVLSASYRAPASS